MVGCGTPDSLASSLADNPHSRIACLNWSLTLIDLIHFRIDSLIRFRITDVSMVTTSVVVKEKCPGDVSASPGVANPSLKEKGSQWLR